MEQSGVNKGCMLEKHVKAMFLNNVTKSKGVLDLVHFMF